MPDALTELVREVRALRADVRRLLARGDRHDALLGAFLQSVFAFARSSTWTATELLDDARRADCRDVLAIVDRIVGDRGDPAKRLGRWLQRHDGAGAAGLILQRVKRENGAWLYSIVECEQ